jgi:mono/diheme cytochrome c family protein
MKSPQAIIVALAAAVVFVAPGAFIHAQSPQPEKKSGSTTAAAARGKRLFQGNCAVCHNDKSDAQKVGPGMKGFAGRRVLSDGTKPTTARLHELIHNGGKQMPAFAGRLGDDQIFDLIAYLRAL